jgi:membrane protein YqaA with SNARE-associated domain
MRSFLIGIFSSLSSWWGLGLIAAMDSLIIVTLPLAVDVAVILNSSRAPETFWVYPIIASIGSIFGAAVTYYLGYRAGDAGLDRFVSAGRLKEVRRKIQTKGAVAIAFLDLVPPPFPFTAFILAAGALKVNPYRFFLWLALTRLLRFGAEAVLAFHYGHTIVNWFKSETFEYIAVFLFGIAVLGTALAVIQLIRTTRMGRAPRRPRAA